MVGLSDGQQSIVQSQQLSAPASSSSYSSAPFPTHENTNQPLPSRHLQHFGFPNCDDGKTNIGSTKAQL
ncbi:hypothetical protein [Nostoc sp. NIES-3756]|uniref:hypothetical protein n=1 Tax=Nostoc sp. NIES-3756 TaxID=1751286 RepID=UPI001E585481|nr:hypothetical protein [Nostoc sp. NIES-3756]